MVIIKSEKHLKEIEKRNKRRRERIFNGEDFKAIEFKENSGEIKVDRIEDYVKPINLDDGKNEKLNETS